LVLMVLLETKDQLAAQDSLELQDQTDHLVP